jgi:hypothetical protein
VAQEVAQEVARTQEVVDSQEVVDIRAHREAARSTAAAVGNLGSICGPTVPLDAILEGKDTERRCSAKAPRQAKR